MCTALNVTPTLKTPVNIENTDNNTVMVSHLTQRTIEVATVAVIVNSKVTTPVTLQIKPKNEKANTKIAQIHRNIFYAMKMIEPTQEVITFQDKIIDTFDQFTIDAKTYTETFKNINTFPKTSRVYISFKVESSNTISELNHGSYTNLPNILKILSETTRFSTKINK